MRHPAHASGAENRSSEVAAQLNQARLKGSRALRTALAITVVFMLLELAGGFWTNSLALLADAGHMLTDAAALGLSLFAVWFTRRPATLENTYGFFRVEILAALVNGTSMLLIALIIAYESYQRLILPEAIKSAEMLAVASVGLVANLASAWILHRSHVENLNLQGAFLHVMGDVLGSVAAIVASLSIFFWQANWMDSAVSLLVSGLILVSAWRLVRDSVLILLEGTPAHINLVSMQRELCKVSGVDSVHDLHVWTLTSGVHAMTCHAVVEPGKSWREILAAMTEVSQERFDIHHTTIQLEDGEVCPSETTFCN